MRSALPPSSKEGAAHPNAAKLWIEYALSPICVNLAAQEQLYQFWSLTTPPSPRLPRSSVWIRKNVMDYDFDDATKNIKTYVEGSHECFLAASGANTGDEPGFPGEVILLHRLSHRPNDPDGAAA